MRKISVQLIDIVGGHTGLGRVVPQLVGLFYVELRLVVGAHPKKR